MEAAVAALRQRKPSQVIVAAPVGARDTCRRLSLLADRVVCPRMPEPFEAVGRWYDEFDQTDDEEVRQTLKEWTFDGGRGCHRDIGSSGHRDI